MIPLLLKFKVSTFDVWSLDTSYSEVLKAFRARLLSTRRLAFDIILSLTSSGILLGNQLAVTPSMLWIGIINSEFQRLFSFSSSLDICAFRTFSRCFLVFILSRENQESPINRPLNYLSFTTILTSNFILHFNPLWNKFFWNFHLKPILSWKCKRYDFETWYESCLGTSKKCTRNI